MQTVNGQPFMSDTRHSVPLAPLVAGKGLALAVDKSESGT